MMDCIDVRAHVLANCNCLYGSDTEVFTFSYESFGSCYQAVAMKYDPFTKSWTKFLHSKDDAVSTNQALQRLLEETEIELANLFSVNGISIPFSGDPVQTMNLNHRVRSRSGVHSTPSDDAGFEFIATPGSTSSEVVIAEATPGETGTAEPEVETESPTGQIWQKEMPPAEEAAGDLFKYVCKEVPEAPCEPEEAACEEAACEKAFPCDEEAVCEETTCEEVSPCEKVAESTFTKEPEPVRDEMFKTSCQLLKDDSVEEPPCESSKLIYEETSQLEAEPEPKVIKKMPKNALMVEKGKKKKSKKGMEFDEIAEPKLEPEVVQKSKKDSKKAKGKKGKKGKGGWEKNTDEEIKDADKPKECFEDLQLVVEACENPNEPYPEPEKSFPEPELVVENDSSGSLIANCKEDRAKLREALVSADPPLSKKPSVEILGAPVTREAEEAFITSTSLPEETTTHGIQPPTGQTVVLTIRHTSQISSKTLHTMVNLAENTKAAIFNAVSLYLDSNVLLVHLPGQRKMEIKHGAGKNGDIDLSALEESKWPEYLEYLRQYTRLPELTVDVLDFYE